jgi:hypothetical protein
VALAGVRRRGRRSLSAAGRRVYAGPGVREGAMSVRGVRPLSERGATPGARSRSSHAGSRPSVYRARPEPRRSLSLSPVSAWARRRVWARCAGRVWRLRGSRAAAAQGRYGWPRMSGREWPRRGGRGGRGADPRWPSTSPAECAVEDARPRLILYRTLGCRRLLVSLAASTPRGAPQEARRLHVSELLGRFRQKSAGAPARRP